MVWTGDWSQGRVFFLSPGGSKLYHNPIHTVGNRVGYKKGVKGHSNGTIVHLIKFLTFTIYFSGVMEAYGIIFKITTLYACRGIVKMNNLHMLSEVILI